MLSNFRSLLISLTLAATIAPTLGHGCLTDCALGGCSPYMVQLCATVPQSTVSTSNTISQCINTLGGFSKCDHTTVNTVTESSPQSSTPVHKTACSPAAPTLAAAILTEDMYALQVSDTEEFSDTEGMLTADLMVLYRTKKVLTDYSGVRLYFFPSFFPQSAYIINCA
ncbi:hypothetical protein DFH06DRAFT_1428765 [Mycena polygramma]|nr:hypothetical protein DFH06DRAFT_1428765 [Mycena polygramma]